MLKHERQNKILLLLNKYKNITVKQLVMELNISDMTARRDLQELSNKGLLLRFHGGAQIIDNKEKSHEEKLDIKVNEKKVISKKAKQIIRDNETIFIGPGTTLEDLALELKNRTLRIVTNSLPVFLILKDSKSIDLILIGGEYRGITDSFIGSITEHMIENIRFSKAFISANAMDEENIYTYSESEGIIQQIALNNAMEKILLIDSSKFRRFDFYSFYKIENINTIITEKPSAIPSYVKLKEFINIK